MILEKEKYRFYCSTYLCIHWLLRVCSLTLVYWDDALTKWATQPQHKGFFLFVFSPSISRVAIVSKSFEGQTDHTEEWYGTHYKQEAIPDEVIKVRLTQLWRGLCVKGTHQHELHRSTNSQPRVWAVTAQCCLYHPERSKEGDGELDLRFRIKKWNYGLLFCVCQISRLSGRLPASCSQRSLKSKVRREAKIARQTGRKRWEWEAWKTDARAPESSWSCWE